MARLSWPITDNGVCMREVLNDMHKINMPILKSIFKKVGLLSVHFVLSVILALNQHSLVHLVWQHV